MRLFFTIYLICSFSYSQPPLKEAQKLIQSKNYVKAEKLLTPLIAQPKPSPKTIELYGDVLCHQHKWEPCSKQYKKLVKIDPKNANYQYKYGGSLGKLAHSCAKLNWNSCSVISHFI